MKLLVLASVLGLFLVAPATSHADRGYPVKAFWKLGRGIGNVCASWVEVPVNMLKEGRRAALDGGNIAEQDLGLFVGTVTGLGYMLARIGVGIFDVATFPVPSRPIMRPGLPHSFLEVALSDDRLTDGVQGTAPLAP